MKKTTEAAKDQTPKTTTATEPKAAKAKKASPGPATEQPAPQPSAAPAKAEKPVKAAKEAMSDTDGEATDRLPTTLDERNRPADPWRVLARGIGGPADREQGAKGGRGCLSAGIRRGGQ